MQKIVPHLWFDNQAKEAAEFYVSAFGSDSKITGTTTLHGTPSGDVDSVTFEILGCKFMAISAGPVFTINPSISFFVMCETEKEVGRLWNRLIEGGQAMMPLDTYDWSEKYGWLQDRFGVTWQISLGKIEEVGQKITPAFLFVNEVFGKAEEALNHYTTIFKNSHVDGILKYGPDEQGPEGMVKHAQFALEGEKFMIMDGPGQHAFHFNEAISLIVYCDAQKEIDYFWDKLSAHPEAEQCGWLRDKYGVSWQIVPKAMDEMMGKGTREQIDRVTHAFLPMKKLDLARLQEAYAG